MLSFYEFLKIYSELEDYMDGIQTTAYEMYKANNSGFDIDEYLKKYNKGEFDDGASEYIESLV